MSAVKRNSNPPCEPKCAERHAHISVPASKKMVIEWCDSHKPVGSDTHGNGCDCKTCVTRRRNWHNAGLVEENKLWTQDSYPHGDRNQPQYIGGKRTPGEYRDGIYWSHPHEEFINRRGLPETTPYKKTFGVSYQVSIGILDLEANGITPDGNVDGIMDMAIGHGQRGEG